MLYDVPKYDWILSNKYLELKNNQKYTFIFDKLAQIAKMRGKWWTCFDKCKSLGICIKLYICEEIILNDYKKFEYI